MPIGEHFGEMHDAGDGGSIQGFHLRQEQERKAALVKAEKKVAAHYQVTIERLGLSKCNQIYVACAGKAQSRSDELAESLAGCLQARMQCKLELERHAAEKSAADQRATKDMIDHMNNNESFLGKLRGGC